ncbi:MAG TPA: hypothetical protein PKB10_04230 [Tepidisphaeraceae bacterium]|nr:hypothetical protein [Tepidisphaeraceae bacterium]
MATAGVQIGQRFTWHTLGADGRWIAEERIVDARLAEQLAASVGGFIGLDVSPADRKQLLADAAEFWERAEAELEGR